MSTSQDQRDAARDRKRAERERNRGAGWVPVNVWVRPENVVKLRKAEKRLQKP